MKRGILFHIVSAAALSVAAIQLPAQQPAQTPAPAPSPSPGGSRGNIPTTPTPTTPGREPFPTDRTRQPQTPSERSPFPQEMPRPIFLSGKVTMSDGTPPPEQVVIERVCNGIARPEAYTDTKGRFHFQLGQNTAMMADASVSSSADNPFGGMGDLSGGQRAGGFGGGQRGGITEQQLMACELRASLPGYRSEMVSLAGRRAMDNPDVGTIILRRLGNVEGTVISITSLQAPKDAKKAYDKGREAMKKKKVADAEKEFNKAVGIYPKYAAAWHELGLTQELQNRPEEARKSYEQALAADDKFVKPYLQIAGLMAREKKWQEVVQTTDRAIRLDPYGFPQAFFYNSVANYNLGNLDAAEKSAREAQKLDTEHRIPKVSHLLGIILADRRDFPGAAQQMRDYLKFAPGAQDADRVRSQLTELEKLSAPTAQQQPQQ